MMPIPTEHTYVSLAWVLLPALAMVALFPILWLIFIRENCYAPLLIFGARATYLLLVSSDYRLCVLPAHLFRLTGLLSDLAVISILSSYSPDASYLPYLPI